jgi:hypothetical protein
MNERRLNFTHHMKICAPLLLLALLGLALFPSCRKEGFVTSSDATLAVSADTLRFDTVFTTTGSITGTLKLFNTNGQRLRISSIRLAGGAASAYRINADGTAGPEATNLELAAGDSLYIFVTVTINPNAASQPFLVRDSLLIRFNGNERKVQLESYGQNAHFLRNAQVVTNTQWTNDLPYVILGPLQVDTGVTLTIARGVRVYCHADAAILVDGTLQVNGTLTDSVVFRGDRLDEGYRDLPASWPGIYFRATSLNNVFTHAFVKNAYQGLVADQPASNASPKLDLRECVVDNAYDAGIIGYHTSIHARNLLVSNSGGNITLVAGGDYQFIHCTVASWSTLFGTHKRPVLVASNWDSVNNQLITYPLNALFENSIFWGDNGTVDDEVVLSRRGNTGWSAQIRYCLYKARNDPAEATITNVIRNENPLFDSVDVGKMIFDLHLTRKPSPALDKGTPGAVTTDLDDRPRGALPDMGCYEKQ